MPICLIHYSELSRWALFILLQSIIFRSFGKGTGHRCLGHEQGNRTRQELRTCMHCPLKVLCAAAKNGKCSWNIPAYRPQDTLRLSFQRWYNLLWASVLCFAGIRVHLHKVAYGACLYPPKHRVLSAFCCLLDLLLAAGIIRVEDNTVSPTCLNTA